jgi:hypothetical protein
MRRILGIATALAMAVFALPTAALAQATLTVEAPPDYYVAGGRVFDNNSKNPMDTSTYYLGSGQIVSVKMGPPKDTGYNLAVLQILVQTRRFGGMWGVTNQGVCNSNIAPVNNQITLALSCAMGQRICGCSIKIGQQIASQGDKACPFTCQGYNPASNSCVGAPMNGCGSSVRPDPPALKCPFTCQAYNPASNSCVGAPMNGC